MNEIIFLIIGLIAGFVAGYFYGKAKAYQPADVSAIQGSCIYAEIGAVPLLGLNINDQLFYFFNV